MSKHTKVNSSDNGERSQQQEFGQEPDWEDIEKNLADYPELAEYEEEIRKRAALQRLFRFAVEENWTTFQTELAEHPDPAEHQEDIRKEAKLERMLRFASEENWEKFKEELQSLRLTAKEDEELASVAFKKFHELAWQQADQSSGSAAPGRAFRVALLYKQLNPQDGIESALGLSLAEMTMECRCRSIRGSAGSGQSSLMHSRGRPPALTKA
jgi:hypothetical protein